MISGSGAIRKATIGKTASGALLDEKGPHGGGHENETVVKLEDIKTFCSAVWHRWPPLPLAKVTAFLLNSKAH